MTRIQPKQGFGWHETSPGVYELSGASFPLKVTLVEAFVPGIPSGRFEIESPLLPLEVERTLKATAVTDALREALFVTQGALVVVLVEVMNGIERGIARRGS